MAVGGFEIRRWAMARVDLVGQQVTSPVFSDTPQPLNTKTGDQVQNVGNFASVARTQGGQAHGDFTLTLAFPLPESQRCYGVTPSGLNLIYNVLRDVSAGQQTVQVLFTDRTGAFVDPSSFDIWVDAYPAH